MFDEQPDGESTAHPTPPQAEPCPKCGGSGWRPDYDANGDRIWKPLMNDALPCECGALARNYAAEKALSASQAGALPAGEGVDILKMFRSGVQFDLHYHGDVRPVSRITHQREGFVLVESGSMLPVVMRTDGTYAGNAPIRCVVRPSTPPAAPVARQITAYFDLLRVAELVVSWLDEEPGAHKLCDAARATIAKALTTPPAAPDSPVAMVARSGWHVQPLSQWIEPGTDLYLHPAAPSAEATLPAGMAMVPMRMTRAMREVLQDEWDWPDLLAAAEAITEDEQQLLEALGDLTHDDFAASPAAPVAAQAGTSGALTDAWIEHKLAAILGGRGFPDTTPGTTSYWVTPDEIRTLFSLASQATTQAGEQK